MKKILRILFLALFALFSVNCSAQAGGFKVTQEMIDKYLYMACEEVPAAKDQIRVTGVKDIIEHTPHIAFILLEVSNIKDNIKRNIFIIVYHNDKGWSIDPRRAYLEENVIEIFNIYPDARDKLIAAGYFPQ